MSAHTMGVISGALVAASAVPYAIRVYERKITLVFTSWSLWSFIGLALLVTYKDSGAKANLWPAIFGFVNPTIITVLAALRRDGKWEKPNIPERICLAAGIASIGMWYLMRDAQYALYAAIFADLCAAGPTFIAYLDNPAQDRPLQWAIFAAGYFLGVFAVTDRTFANYVLPVYMTVGALAVAFPLARYRWRNRMPLKEWI